MDTLLLEEMTWPEIRDALQNGMRTVVVCAASIEQHGPHLAERTDTTLGYAEAEALARRLGNALVAPVIRPGLSAHHMVLPGTVTLRPEVFRGVVEDYISSYVQHGFTTIVLISSHGGNFAALEEIAAAAAPQYPDVKIVTGPSIEDLMALFTKAEQQEGLEPTACGGHACDFETSVMLHIAPQQVRPGRAQRGFMGPVTRGVVTKMFEKGVLAVSEIGVMGDPTHADAARGARYHEAMADLLETTVRKKLGR